jgi:hypothetical protein
MRKITFSMTNLRSPVMSVNIIRKMKINIPAHFVPLGIMYNKDAAIRERK